MGRFSADSGRRVSAKGGTKATADSYPEPGGASNPAQVVAGDVVAGYTTMSVILTLRD